MSWDGVEFKHGAAGFYLGEMSRDLTSAIDRPETRTYAAVHISSPGTIVGNLWQNRFYFHLDAFIQAARSIPDIIQWQFGLDPHAPKDWTDALSTEELARREKFQKEFAADFAPFRDLPLSKARVMTVHRTGTPPVQVELMGQWGEVYRGSPLQSLPIADRRPAPVGDTPAEYVPVISSPATPLEPRAQDFWLEWPDGNRHPLFQECNSYLQAAGVLIERTRTLKQAIHGDAALTPPP
jgi:hypothetical protein